MEYDELVHTVARIYRREQDRRARAGDETDVYARTAAAEEARNYGLSKTAAESLAHDVAEPGVHRSLS